MSESSEPTVGQRQETPRTIAIAGSCIGDYQKLCYDLERDLAASRQRFAELEAVLARANPPPERAYECLEMLDAAGMGKNTHGNTLTGMVKEVCEWCAELKKERNDQKERLQVANIDLANARGDRESFRRLYQKESDRCVDFKKQLGTAEEQLAVVSLLSDEAQKQKRAAEAMRESIINYWLKALGGKCIPNNHFPDGLYATTEQALAERDSLRARIAELEQDKERLTWIHDQIGDGSVGMIVQLAYWMLDHQGQDFREAFDIARKQ